MIMLLILCFPQLNVRCSEKDSTPSKITGGSATTNHKFAYFTTSDLNVYRYHWSTGRWEEIRRPCYDSKLAVIHGEITTAVGGQDGCYCCTNKTLRRRQRQWIEEYPPMNTARSHMHAAVVSSSDGEYHCVCV